MALNWLKCVFTMHNDFERPLHDVQVRYKPETFTTPNTMLVLPTVQITFLKLRIMKVGS